MDVNTTENGATKKGSPSLSTTEYHLKSFQASLNLLAHLFIGFVVAGSLIFTFRSGLPIGPMPIHIVLCVLGFQLLMAEAILSLSPHNGWSAHLKLVDKRRAHWVLLIAGSALAIAGSFIIIVEKDVNWNTLHGQFGLVALVFTVVSLVNGVTSLYAYEMRKCIPGKLSKLTHILFGIVGFVAATISLCYGFEKRSFMNWAGAGNTYTLMAFTGAFTLIIIIAPFITFFTKIKSN